MPDAPVSEPQLRDSSASFAEVDIRGALGSRPYRPPDYEAEDRALAVLAAELAENPQNMLQKLVETALDLCRADTAGISLLETQGGVEVFRWEALAGVFASARNKTMPRKAGPSGVCLDENATQLMYLPDRCFPALRSDPRFVEALLIPFQHHGRPVGTVWIVTHRFDRKFDGEDERLMRTLAAFASAAWQLWRATADLAEKNATLIKEIEERKRAEEELRRAQRQLSNLPAMLVVAQETERRTLARELHDDLSQKLVALGMEASTVVLKSPRESADVFDWRMRNLVQKIGVLADDVHRISRQLHPAILGDLGLEAALREECASFSQRLGFPVEFKAQDVPRSIPGEIALCLFRVAQESLRNIQKHAHATEVRVLLACGKSRLALFVQDRGDGFDVVQARGRGGLGLISMEERVRVVNGDFKIRSQPGDGTVVEVHVPLPDKEPS